MVKLSVGPMQLVYKIDGLSLISCCYCLLHLWLYWFALLLYYFYWTRALEFPEPVETIVQLVQCHLHFGFAATTGTEDRQWNRLLRCLKILVSPPHRNAKGFGLWVAVWKKGMAEIFLINKINKLNWMLVGGNTYKLKHEINYPFFKVNNIYLKYSLCVK